MLRRIVAIAVLSLLVACGGDGEEPSPGSEGQLQGEELVVQVASYDLAAGEPARFIAGVLTQDQLFVSHGEVDLEFFYLGTEDGEGTAEEGPTATGEFLPIEGDPGQEGPIAAPASSGRGVYGAEVTFDEAGFWAVELTAEIEGEKRGGRAVFEVTDEHRFPAVGDEAPRTANRTLESDVPPGAIDSRATTVEDIPDPEMHRMTIAESIKRGEPAVVVFATPVYCVSRFCGPITDMIGDLGKKYSDRANFIHVEIWFDFQDQAVNKAAAEWLLVDRDLIEPWVYLIDADGKIAARWDNVATRAEVEAELQKLPKL
jgi:hypothetical protein